MLCIGVQFFLFSTGITLVFLNLIHISNAPFCDMQMIINFVLCDTDSWLVRKYKVTPPLYWNTKHTTTSKEHLLSAFIIMNIINFQWRSHSSVISGWSPGKCYWLVSQPSWVWLLAFWHWCFHSDAEPKLPGAFCSHCYRPHSHHQLRKSQYWCL